MTRKIDNCDTYVQQLEDIVSEYDAMLLAIAITNVDKYGHLYTELKATHGDARRHAIDQAVSRRVAEVKSHDH